MAEDLTNKDQENQPQDEPEVMDEEMPGEPEGEEEEEAAEGEEAKPSLAEMLKEVVEVQAEDVGTLRKKLTVTIPRDFVDQQKDEQYGELRRDAVVPGFRRGRAPRRLLEKRFGSDVNETLVQQLVTNGYLAAVEKLDLKVIGDPLVFVREKDSEGETLVDVQKAIDLIELPDEGPLTFSCEIEVQPEFELPSLEAIPLEKLVVTVKDEDVTQQIERLRMLHGRFEPVPDDAIQADDMVYADVKVMSGETTLHEHENIRLAARPQVLEGISLPQLGETLAGAKVGESRTATGTIPDDYEKAEFRGKEASIEFRIREIHRLKLPELNEEFVKGIGFENEEELRKYIREDMESRIDYEIRRGMRGQVQKYLLEKTSFDLPERLSNRQISQVVVRRMYDLYNEGVPPAEVEKRMDELKTTARETAVRDLKLAFIMEKLAEQIHVDVSEGEMNAYIAEIARRQSRRFDRVRDELIKQGGATSLYLSLRDEKILDKLVESAQVTEKTPPAGGEAQASGGQAESGQNAADAT
jgi:trigger factor